MNRYYNAVFMLAGVFSVWEVCSSQSSVIPSSSGYLIEPGTFGSPEQRFKKNRRLSEGQKCLILNGSQKQQASIKVDSNSPATVRPKQENLNGRLFEAIDQGDIRAVEQAYKNGASVHAKNGFYSTPLHVAASKGSIEILSLLLEMGAKTSVKDAFGETPFDIASERGDSACMNLLQEYANPS